MSPSAGGVSVTAYGFPRVSGDEPSVGLRPHFFALFSPRERG